MRGAKPPLSHTCAVFVLEEWSGCYLSESIPSASAFKYTRIPLGICLFIVPVFEVGT